MVKFQMVRWSNRSGGGRSGVDSGEAGELLTMKKESGEGDGDEWAALGWGWNYSGERLLRF